MYFSFLTQSPKRRKLKKADVQSIHSESQRMLRGGAKIILCKLIIIFFQRCWMIHHNKKPIYPTFLRKKAELSFIIIYSFLHSLIRSFFYSYMCLIVHPFIHKIIYPSLDLFLVNLIFILSILGLIVFL